MKVQFVDSFWDRLAEPCDPELGTKWVLKIDWLGSQFFDIKTD